MGHAFFYVFLVLGLYMPIVLLKYYYSIFTVCILYRVATGNQTPLLERQRTMGKKLTKEMEAKFSTICYMARNAMVGDEEETRIDDPQWYKRLPDDVQHIMLEQMRVMSDYNGAIRTLVRHYLARDWDAREEWFTNEYQTKWVKEWHEEMGMEEGNYDCTVEEINQLVNHWIS